jgi:hypothetical protein
MMFVNYEAQDPGFGGEERGEQEEKTPLRKEIGDNTRN